MSTQKHDNDQKTDNQNDQGALVELLIDPAEDLFSLAPYNKAIHDNTIDEYNEYTNMPMIHGKSFVQNEPKPKNKRFVYSTISYKSYLCCIYVFYMYAMCSCFVYIYIIMCTIYMFILYICSYTISYCCYIHTCYIHICYIYICYIRTCYIHICYMHTCYIYICDIHIIYTYVIYVHVIYTYVIYIHVIYIYM